MVIGGGAAGALTAARLLDQAARHGQTLSVTVVEPRQALGGGVAFSTRDQRHLLNVPAFKMSAYPEDGEHFLRWLAAAGHQVAPADFVPREWYGAYLAEVVDTAAKRAPTATFRHLRAAALDITAAADRRCRVHLAGGGWVEADAAVLAVGHLGLDLSWAPAALRDSPRFVFDPWAPGALDAIPETADLLMVGSGLTMVDALVALDRDGRVVHAISRHGAVPHPHLAGLRPAMEAPEFSTPTPSLVELHEVMTRHIAKAKQRYGDWRPAIDSIRALTQKLWSGLSEAERREFLAIDARAWEAMRHRIPPASAAVVAGARRDGRLVTHTAHVRDAVEAADGIAVRLSDGETVRVGAVINCTGPRDRPELSEHRLVRALIDRGTAAPGPMGIGLDTAADGRLRSASGGTRLPVWTLGSLRKGSLWESTAIPEIRDQAAALARCLVRPGTRRDARPVDPYGLRLSTHADAAAAWCRGLDAIRRVQAGAEDALAEAVRLDPDFAVGHAALALIGHECDASVDVPASLQEAVRASQYRGDQRERAFVSMVHARVTLPRADADRELRRYVAEHPRDCLAVSVALPTIAFSGLAQPVEASWALVEALAPSYGEDWWFDGIHAFSLQEQERWAAADRLASRALSLEPAAGHAAHARTHVFYETGQDRAGLEWLQSWISAHGPATNHRAHFSWHAALHELALDDVEAARRRYHAELAPPAVTGARALIDSASLLWRLRVLDAWQGALPVEAIVASVDECVFDRPATPFAALHAVVGLAAAGDVERLDRLQSYAAAHPDPVFPEVVAPLCAGFAAVVADTPSEAIAPLTDVVGQARRLGGSAAQQEVITETLLHALLATGRGDTARAILSERVERRHSASDHRRVRALR